MSSALMSLSLQSSSGDQLYYVHYNEYIFGAYMNIPVGEILVHDVRVK